MTDMDRHIQQTTDRLLCIKQHLGNPSGFQNAARELLEWCSDPRAFQGPFEPTLISCLTVVSQVAAQPGFDLELGYRLLAVCAAHREKFTQKASGLLSMWTEDLGRLLLLRHQKTRSPDCKPQDMHPQMQKPMGPMGPGDPNGGWQGNPGGPQQSLSVVTTVWGVTPTTQTTPYNQHNNPSGFSTNTTMSTTNYTQPPQGFPGNQMQKPGYENPSVIYNRRDSYPCPSGYPPTPNTPGSTTPNTANPKNNYHAPAAAVSAAALVAAAATATATATATASMLALQEQQNQQQQLDMQMGMNNHFPPQMQPMPPAPQVGQQPGQYSNQYGGMPQRHPNAMGMGRGPGPGPANQGPGPMKPSMMAMYARRAAAAPYQNPQMMQKRQISQYPNGQYGPQPPYQQYPTKPQYPAQQPLPSPTYGPQPGMRPNGPYANGQNPYMVQGQFPPSRQTPAGPGYNQFSSSPTQQPFQPNPTMNYPHSPLPGNPTPPMTPNNIPPYPADVKPNPNMISNIKKDIDELRLTFPVRDGVVLPPFRLEHNLAVSNHVFHLRESVYQTLMWRSDLELQLKCFHHEDRQMNTNWPASVTVSVNATPLSIERGENKTSHRPLYLKEVCRPGRNTIQITVTACCCSHLFVLQLVHRPSVRSVLQGLLRKRLLPAEHCITKIKRNFTSAATNNSALNGEDGVEQTGIKVSLKCPITFRRIMLPARGHDCKHIQCFDLESYLQLNCERGQWRCPVCNKPALLEGLEIDQYIWGILTNLASTEFEEVTIDPTASWKPVPIKSIKEEDTGSDPCSRWMKAMSPHSMQLPTMSSLDMGPQQSPYNMPPSSQGPPFSGSYGPGGPTGPGGAVGSTNYPQNAPPAEFTGSMLPMSPGVSLNNMTSGDMMNKPITHSGQYPLSPGQYPVSPPTDPNNSNLRHPDQQNMANHLPPSTSQSPAVNNHPSANGTHPLSHTPQQPPVSSNQQSTPGDDLNFDPTAIIDGDGSTPGLELENLGDPLELLSYLGPSEPGDTNGGQSNSIGNSNNNDDILSFFAQ